MSNKYNLLTFLVCYFFDFFAFSTTEISVVGWGYHTSRKTSAYVSRKSSSHIIPPNFCRDPTFLVIMIYSAPKNWYARDSIRTTWAKTTTVLGLNISHFFLLGKTNNETIKNNVRDEYIKYGDIIVEDFNDSYSNLTLKSIYTQKLATLHCLNTAKYLLKIDDDMLLNTHLLVKLLLIKNVTENVLFGKLQNSTPIRKTSSKWYSSRYMFRDKVYPLYLSGTSYAMSVDITKKLFETAFTTPIFHLEDIYITGMCAKKSNITLIAINSLMRSNRKRKNICKFINQVTWHSFSPKKLQEMYRLLRTNCSIAV